MPVKQAEHDVSLDKGTMSVESAMTELLERAVAAAASRPPDEQDALASLLLTELEAENRWAEVLSKAPTKLQRLAEQALEEIRAGRAAELDPDRL